ncbi:MAG: 2OG-Fe(II) oxygenase, partial [Erythrobacter sp.]|nr:2OG-Fe(II) oxygenase [Erythrobacter sp.]
LAELDRREATPANALTRANLLRRSGDLAAARAALDLPDAADPWSVIPPGLASGGFALAPLAVIDGVLPAQRMHALHAQACALSGEFVDRISGAGRQGASGAARVLVHQGSFDEQDFFRTFLDEQRDRLRACLGMPDFAVSALEVKLTNNFDGGNLPPHSDHAAATADEGRAITCIYYFSGPGQEFAGGDLLVFDSDPQAHRYSPSWFTRVRPQPNRMIAFPSWFYHAVTPASGKAGDFASGRMAISCQIRKAAGELDLWWDSRRSGAE